VGLDLAECGSVLGLGAQHCGSFPHQKQAGEAVLSLTNCLRGFEGSSRGTFPKVPLEKSTSSTANAVHLPQGEGLDKSQFISSSKKALGNPQRLIFDRIN